MFPSIDEYAMGLFRFRLRQNHKLGAHIRFNHEARHEPGYIEVNFVRTNIYNEGKINAHTRP